MRASPSITTVICVGFCVLTLSFGTRALIGLGMPTWSDEFHWSKTALSSVAALALCGMALLVSLSGYASDRWGARGILAMGCASLALALALMAAMDSLWLFGLGYGVAGGIGFGLASLPVVGALVVRSASRRPGLATGITTAGATAGPLLMLPLMAWLFSLVGWRSTLAMMAVLCLLVMGLVLWLIRTPASPVATSTPASEGFTTRLGRYARSPVFHGLFWSFTFCGFTSTGVVETHLIPFAQLCGFAPLPSTVAYSVFAASNFAGMLLAGYLADRIDRQVLLTVIYLLRAVAFVIPLFIGSQYSWLLAFSMLVGFAFYATFPATIGLSAAHFGKEQVGSVMGILSVGHALGAAAGALASGYIADLFLRYDGVWYLSIILACASAAFVLLVPDPREKNAHGQ